MKVLVTGATGFIGSALVRAIEAAGHEVVGLTRQASPVPRTRRYITVDLNDVAAVAQLGRQVQPDAIVHAAAVMSNRVATTTSDYTSNEPITRQLLHAFENAPPRCLLYIGSIDVYGAPATVLTEQALTAPATPYAASKLDAEVRCREWCRTRGVQPKMARFTQIFGPGDPTAKFIPNCLRAAKAGQPISLFGDGEDRRDYLFVHDAGQLVARWLPIEGGADCLNFVSGTSHSMNEILALVRPLAPIPLQVDRQPRRKARQDFTFDASALRRALGAYQLTSMADALRITYDSLV